tara:strand:- start:244 stop:510 length:267 start_codon:yes stop_codon:yes gene_type:complete
MANKNPLNKLITKRQLKEDLTHILETPQGQRFFEVLLRECHVTKPVFHSDDSKLREAEGRRRFAMSLLTLVAQDNPQAIIDRLEKEVE